MSEPLFLVRFYQPQLGARVGVQRGTEVFDISETFPSVAAWLRETAGRGERMGEELLTLTESATPYPASSFDRPPDPFQPHWLAVVDRQDVWAAGVTYRRSREARQEEAKDGGDVYARVYDAERPELFFKAKGPQVVGHLDTVGIRADSQWNVPEPELALVINPALEIVGLTAGNDVSSRDIEGANPLYLPQAKMYTAACAVGRAILVGPMTEFPHVEIELAIKRKETVVFSGSINTDQIRRGAGELVDYLGRSLNFPDGAVLLTGTGIVPPADFTLQAGDEVRIRIDSITELVNSVRVV